MKKKLTFMGALLLSCVLYVLIFIILALGNFYGFHISIVTGILLFGIMTYRLRKKALTSRDKWIKTILIALPTVSFGCYCLTGQVAFSYSPPFFFGPLTGILLALAYEKVSSIIYKTAITLMPFVIGAWLYFQGGKVWQHYVIYETFGSGETWKKAPAFSFVNGRDALTNSDFKGRIVVLDFWNTSCPYCYRKFPVLKEKQEKWSQYKEVTFYSVNCPVVGKDSIGEAEAVLRNNHIKMTSLIGPNADVKIFYSMGIRVFPTTVILNTAGDVVFWGDIERIDQTLGKLVGNPD